MRYPKKIGIITWGGLGDVILLTPSLREIKKKYPKCELIVLYFHYNHYQVLLNNPYVDTFLSVQDTISYKYFSEDDIIYKCCWGHLIPCKNHLNVHAIDLISNMLKISVQNKQVEVFFEEAECRQVKEFISQFKNPIIIQGQGSCSDFKNWHFDRWEKIVKAFPEYTFIQVGEKHEKKIEGTIDLRGKTSIRGVMILLKYSKLLIGVDSFLNHVAPAVGVKGIILFGPTSPDMVGHKANSNIFLNFKCSPCIDFLLMHGNHYCKNNNDCMNNILTEEVIRKISIELESKKLSNSKL